MKPPPRYHQEAANELVEKAARYEEAREGLGAKFLAAVTARIDDVFKMPALASRVTSCPADVVAWRVLLRHPFPHAVVFLDHQGSMLVIAVAHQRQEPGYWAHRTPT